MQCRSPPTGPPGRCLDPPISVAPSAAGCGGQDMKDPHGIHLHSAPPNRWCGTRAAGPQQGSRRSTPPLCSSEIWHSPPRYAPSGGPRQVDRPPHLRPPLRLHPPTPTLERPPPPPSSTGGTCRTLSPGLDTALIHWNRPKPDNTAPTKSCAGGDARAASALAPRDARAEEGAGGGGGLGMTPWCVVLVCSWRRLLAECHSLPFPRTLSLHRRRCPSASHHPLTFLFLPALTFPLPFPFPSLGLSLRRPQCPSASHHSFPSHSLGRGGGGAKGGYQAYLAP